LAAHLLGRKKGGKIMSTMKNHLGSFLSRLALFGLAVPLILLLPALVRADAIRTFAVSGTATNTTAVTLGSCAPFSTCALSGMFRVDTTTGTVESSGLDITLPGLPAFDVLRSSGMGTVAGIFFVGSNDSSLDVLIFDFTAPGARLGSLVGFTGGSIVGGIEKGIGIISGYDDMSGSITPVPEPSSLVLFASGIGLLVFGLTRRFGKKVGHAPSA
jgi:hypothetical protein